METTISVPDLSREAELTAIANAVMSRAGQPAADRAFLVESERVMLEGTDSPGPPPA